MSDIKIHPIPHPLCVPKNPKVSRDNLEDIEEYVRDCGNPRWGASHLIRAISNGLRNEDIKTYLILRELANDLATTIRPVDPTQPTKVASVEEDYC